MQACQATSAVRALSRACKRFCIYFAGVDVKADNLACLVGCGAVLDVLFFSIAAAGEGILIPAPYYPAFKNDLEVPLAIENC